MYAGYYGQASVEARAEICKGARKNAARVKEALSDLLGIAVTAFVLIAMLAAIVLLPGTKKEASRSAGAAVEVSGASADTADIVLLSDADSN